MTVYSWHAYAGNILEAEGCRTDHKGSPEALAVEVAADLRVAGVAVTRVSVRMVGAVRMSGCVDPVVGDSEGRADTPEATMPSVPHRLSTPLQHGSLS